MVSIDKSWFKYGCVCVRCLESKRKNYLSAYQKYEQTGELDITIRYWENDDDYGETLFINGLDCGEVMHSPNDAISRTLEFLNIKHHVEYISDIDNE